MRGRKPTLAPTLIIDAILHFKNEIIDIGNDGEKSKYSLYTIRIVHNCT